MEPSRSSPSVDDVRAQLERMLEGVSFRASQRRRAMLRFIVDETLAGRGDRLKGVTVALAVFGRDETFDQRSDPVVRLEARRLRTDLDSYYVDAGSQDPVRITIPKGGYVPHFAWQNGEARPPEPYSPDAPLPAMDAAGTSSTGAEATVERRRGRLTLAIALLAVGGLAVIGAAVIGLRGAGSDVAMARTPAIIVLPFEAFGDIDDIGLIASGVTEELIANLMLFRDFRVYSTTTSFRQDAGADPENLGRDLGVSFVVTGVMQAQNGRVHLRARLVDTQTGEVRWSGSYDQPLTAGNLLGAQQDLAVAISTELGEPYGAVNEAIGQRMITDSAPSMPSYACILRAYDYRRTFSKALFAPAMACLKQAVVRDPDYADAWAMLGWLHLDAVRRDFVPEAERPAEMAAAFDAASHAVKLGPRNPRALAALSVITFYQGDYAAAEVLQREVLALNPYDPDTLAQLGWRLAVRGNREGLEYLEQAVARSANPPGWYYNLIAVYAYLDGDYARALTAAEISATSGSATGMSFAAMSHAKLGDMEAARDALAAMAKAWPLLGRDPAAAYRVHHATDAMVEALVEGLRAAGWTPPDARSQ
jgi:TolB-like protein/Tfp pilus assembly protein PilF